MPARHQADVPDEISSYGVLKGQIIVNFKKGEDPTARLTALAVKLAAQGAKKNPGTLLYTNKDGTFVADVMIPTRTAIGVSEAFYEARNDPSVIAAGGHFFDPPPADDTTYPYALDHIRVTFKKDKNPAKLITALAVKLASINATKNPGEITHLYSDGSFYAVVLIPKEMSETEAVSIALKDPTVESAQLDEYAESESVTFGFVTINSKLGNNLVFDIDGASTANGARMQVYTRNWTVAQVFQVIYNKEDRTYTIKNPRSGKVLDVPGNNAVEGQRLHQYAPNGTDAQRWVMASYKDGFTLAPKSNPSLRVDVIGASKTPGTSLQLYRENGTMAQRFIFGPNEQNLLPEGTYKIATANNTQQVLDVAGAASANGTNVQLYKDNGTNAQRFSVKFDEATGTYMLTSLAAKKPLDVDGAKTTDGANVQVYASNNTLAQRWRVEMISYRTYRIYSSCSGLALDAAGGATANGTNVHTWTPNGTKAQVWVVTAV
jgi:hypothetical protein